MTTQYIRFPALGGAGGIVSINGDTTSAQVIAGGSGISVSTATGTTTITNTSPLSSLSVGSLDGNTASADGASLAAGVLYMQSASASDAGLVNTSAQTFAGTKTFSEVISPLIYGSASASGNLTLQGTTNATPGYVVVNNLSSLIIDANPSDSILPYASITPAGGVLVSNTLSHGGLVLAGDNGVFSYVYSSTGSFASPSQITSTIYEQEIFAYNGGAAYHNQNLVAALQFSATSAHTTTSMPSELILRLTPTNHTSATAIATITGDGSWTFNYNSVLGVTPQLLWGTDNTGNIGASGANRPANIYAATNIYVGSNPVLTQSLTSGDIFVGNGSNVATAVAMSGDATLANTGALTLATVNSTTGSFGSSTAIPSFTVNGKGLITAASTNVVIAPAGTLTGTTLASNVVSSSLTSVGTIGTGTWQGTAIGATYGGTGGSSASSTGIAHVSSGTWSYSQIVNADISNSAAIATSKIALNAPTVQNFTSGSGTYTTPAGVLYLEVTVVGDGGGGGGGGNAGSTSGGAGSGTTFGTSLFTAGGGGAGVANAGNGGAGGSATLAAGPIPIFVLNGGSGSGGNGASALSGGSGGNSALGGGGGGGQGGSGGGIAGATNTGGGGGGGGAAASNNSGGGGGSGAYIVAQINSPASTYSYSVGGGGSAGSALAGNGNGGAGGSGYIVIREFYQ